MNHPTGGNTRFARKGRYSGRDGVRSVRNGEYVRVEGVRG